jgi:hypothetical protein
MMGRFNRIFLLAMVFFLVQGCASKTPNKVSTDYSKINAKRIAILPVSNKTDNAKAGQILREVVLNELYFKGYQKIPLHVIDEKLLKIYKGDMYFKRENIPPKAMGEVFGVDAVLYVTLDECSTSFAFVYAPTRVSVFFELRSAKTGETLWSSRHRTVKRNYGISREQLELESCQVYEPAIREVVNKAVGTLPDGPDGMS